ncbi:MAG TPA: FkbM family methyltransferase [Solirubrobacteraceae bacterium]
MGARSFVTVAYARELIEAPELLGAYAAQFADGDDATLVLYAPDEDPALVAAALQPTLAQAGADGADGPDLMALIVPAADGDPVVAAAANALLSRRAELGAVPRFDETSVDRLRAQAESSWRPALSPEPALTPAPFSGSDEERFQRDLAAYRALPGGASARDEDLFPQLGDWREVHELDAHYFHQDTWAANRIAELRPGGHVDVGSRIDLVGFLTAVTEVTFVDIRPLEVDIERLTCVAGSILDLPFADRSLESVSCLHVAEHIGLGRYGDPLDPAGSLKAMAELQRVVAPGGHLLFSGPIGRPRVCFNAHRIHDPVAILERFAELELVEFAVVDDSGRFMRHRDPAAYRGLTYGCGMFLLRRPQAAVEPTFEVPADMAWAFEGGEFVERDVTALFDDLMAETATGAVYDVGANCGWFAVRAARAGRAVRAFEPVPATAEYAERNLGRVAGADARVVRAAVADAPGSAIIHLYSSSGNNSLHERTLPAGHPLRRTGDIEVSVVRLDDLVGSEGFPAPALIKIDVEGAELAVLHGARETLARHRPLVVMEWAESTSRDAGHARAAIVAELRGIGYTALAITPEGEQVDPDQAGDECGTLVGRPA